MRSILGFCDLHALFVQGNRPSELTLDIRFRADFSYPRLHSASKFQFVAISMERTIRF
jgi:hypothetical protein